MKKIITISGSLRNGSFNTYLVDAVKELVPEAIQVEMVEIRDIPMYNGDLEANFPKEAEDFKDKIMSANAIIIATPEYNRSIPGVLKNAIDWASRPYGKNAFVGKPVLVLGASSGPIGTAVAQSHLKQIMLYLDAKLVGQPEFYLGNVQDKFNGEGKLTDEKTREILKKALDVLISNL